MATVEVYLPAEIFDLTKSLPTVTSVEDHKDKLIAEIKKAIIEEIGVELPIIIHEVRSVSVNVIMEGFSIKAAQAEALILNVGMAIYYHYGLKITGNNIHLTMQKSTITHEM